MNYCSLQTQLPSWDFEHLELLFAYATSPAGKLVMSGFGLHNCAVFYPDLSQHKLCEVSCPACVANYCSLFTQLDARPNKKTHANAWVFSR